MENPEPVREHHELDKLAGHFAGPERMHPSSWNPTAVKAEAVTDGRVALDGFAIVQDYEQRLEDGSRFAGHGVFRYDMPSDTYEMHWFDSTGGAPRLFRGGFADRMLVLNGRAGDSWQRLTYDFNLTGGYRFKMETSDDGNNWSLALEGDNFLDAGAAAETPPKRQPAKKAAARQSSARPASKRAAKKTAARNAGGKNAARKTSARKTASSASARKKPAARKAAAKKTGARKPAAKKATARKSPVKKAVTKKAATKKTAARKTAAKKTAAGKTRAKKAGARTTVAAIERKRRQGKASKTVAVKKAAAKKTAARGNGRAAAPVAQKKTKGAAQRSPQMPGVKKTSTRTGWHRTAAKGTRVR